MYGPHEQKTKTRKQQQQQTNIEKDHHKQQISRRWYTLRLDNALNYF